MRRVKTAHNERGAAAVILALLMVPLMGFGALVIDVGALVQERRELQNGADAAALAVAKDCAEGSCGAVRATANSFADANALDGDSNVDAIPDLGVCGRGDPLLTACSPEPPEAAGVPNYVRVRTNTQEVSSGTNQITFKLGQLLGLTGAPVDTSSTVAWGYPSAATTIPLTISICQFNAATASGTNYTAGPPFTVAEDGAPLKIRFHDDSAVCGGGSSGTDFPGGFGWLANVGCSVAVAANGTVRGDTGNSVPSGCNPPDWLNKTVLMPIYDTVSGNGSGGVYRIRGFAALHIVGYRFPSESSPSGFKCSDVVNSPGDNPGNGSPGDTCIRGYFTQFVTSADAFGGPAMGAFAITTIG